MTALDWALNPKWQEQHARPVGDFDAIGAEVRTRVVVTGVEPGMRKGRSRSDIYMAKPVR